MKRCRQRINAALPPEAELDIAAGAPCHYAFRQMPPDEGAGDAEPARRAIRRRLRRHSPIMFFCAAADEPERRQKSHFCYRETRPLRLRVLLHFHRRSRTIYADSQNGFIFAQQRRRVTAEMPPGPTSYTAAILFPPKRRIRQSFRLSRLTEQCDTSAATVGYEHFTHCSITS